MRRHGIESTVVSLRSAGAVGPKLEQAGIAVTALGLPGMAAFATSRARLVSVLRAFSPTVLHGWMYHGNLAALSVGRRLGLPVAWGIRQSLGLGTRDKWFTRRVIGVSAWLSGRAQLIVYNSIVARAQHEARGFAAASGSVVPNGFDTEVFRPDPKLRASVRGELRVPNGAPVIIQVARYHPGKDYPTLMRAAARVVAAVPHVQFLLVGDRVDESNRALRLLVRELKLEANVQMLGRRDDVARLLCGADVAALTSAGMEGFPNAIGEAMSSGVPCVGTRVGDLPQLIGTTGEIVAPSDHEAVAAALLRLISLSADERRALGQRARQRIIDDFSIDQVAIRYAGVLLDLPQHHS
jgi:glycosyltransferase involved in cell wall biosynthesis